jgi:zinc protease
MPDAGQAAVYVGRATSPRGDDDYYIGQVANSVLGGGFSARLNREIRIKRGLSYGCGSRLSAYRGAGIFGAATQTKNESAAEVVEAIRSELARLGEETVPEAELSARIAVITGGFQRDLETNEGYVKRIADFVVHGQAADSFASILEKFKQVKPGDVQAFAKKKLSPDETSVVVVGNAAECEERLRKALPGLRKIRQADLNLESPGLTSQKKAH